MKRLLRDICQRVGRQEWQEQCKRILQWAFGSPPEAWPTRMGLVLRLMLDLRRLADNFKRSRKVLLRFLDTTKTMLAEAATVAGRLHSHGFLDSHALHQFDQTLDQVSSRRQELAVLISEHQRCEEALERRLKCFVEESVKSTSLSPQGRKGRLNAAGKRTARRTGRGTRSRGTQASI